MELNELLEKSKKEQMKLKKWKVILTKSEKNDKSYSEVILWLLWQLKKELHDKMKIEMTWQNENL